MFVWVEALRPSQQVFSNVGTEPPLPGYYQYFFGEVNVSCLRIQHGDLSADRTLNNVNGRTADGKQSNATCISIHKSLNK